MSTPLELNQLAQSGTGRALDAMLKGQEVLDTFVEFTSDLIRNVIETIISTSMEQLQAYAELVASVSGTVENYEQRTFPDIDGETAKYVNGYIKTNFGDSSWTGEITANKAETLTISAAKIPDFKALFAGLIVAESTVESIIQNGAVKPSELFDFAKAKLKSEIKSSYDKLIMILKLGMQKIVITKGKIYTKMTFHVHGEDSDQQDVSNTVTDSLAKSSSWGASLSGRLRKKAYQVSASGYYNAKKSSSVVKVNVVNEKKSAVTTIDIDITGGVELEFKSDYFPSIDPPQLATG